MRLYDIHSYIKCTIYSHPCYFMIWINTNSLADFPKIPKAWNVTSLNTLTRNNDKWVLVMHKAYWLKKWSFHFYYISSNCCTYKDRIYMCGKCDCLFKQCISITVFEVLSAANVGRTTGKNNGSQIEACYTISSISLSSAGNDSY